LASARSCQRQRSRCGESGGEILDIEEIAPFKSRLVDPFDHSFLGPTVVLLSGADAPGAYNRIVMEYPDVD
jgi:hypothetical protein